MIRRSCRAGPGGWFAEIGDFFSAAREAKGGVFGRMAAFALPDRQLDYPYLAAAPHSLRASMTPNGFNDSPGDSPHRESRATGRSAAGAPWPILVVAVGIFFAVLAIGAREVLLRRPRPSDRERQSAYIHHTRAFNLQVQKDLKGAIAEYRSALQLTPDDAVLHYNL